jgi:hypothetical protein
MTMSENETIRRYLLGQATEAEAEELEAAYFDDPAALADVRAVEAELLDAYARGGLDPGLRALVEGRYGESPALAERLAFARALPKALERGGGPRRRAWGPSLAIAASTLLALATTGLLVDRARLTRRADDLSADARNQRLRGDALESALQQQRAPRATAPPLAVELAPLLRGDGAAASFAATAAEVELRLRADAGRYPRFSVAIDGPDGVAVWAGAGRREGGTVVARVPGALLTPRRYDVALSGVGLGPEPEVLHRYALRVTP